MGQTGKCLITSDSLMTAAWAQLGFGVGYMFEISCTLWWIYIICL